MAAGFRKKLSPKTIVGNVKARMFDTRPGAKGPDGKELPPVALANGVALPLFTIGGIANNIENGESVHGAYTAFKGEFGAQPLDADGNPVGEMLESSTCFLPDEVTPRLVNAVMSGKVPARVDAHGVIVEDAKVKAMPCKFAYLIGMKRRDDVAVGYEYYVVNLIQTERSNPLSEVMNALQTGGKTVGEEPPAPAKETEAEKHKGKKK